MQLELGAVTWLHYMVILVRACDTESRYRMTQQKSIIMFQFSMPNHIILFIDFDHPFGNSNQSFPYDSIEGSYILDKEGKLKERHQRNFSSLHKSQTN